ncbi:MAG: nucleotide pyrophosphohydrolase [Clostridiales bacterium]|jgi:NTP pyrophosphatase (non-canonical NTP hydrolase)|nr:nucleotide pyrophosphohydrolase [Clostridiales bacterium]
MNDKTTTIAEIKKHIQDFSDARGWRKDQNAKDLVMALSVEAAELSEIFMWLHSDNADSVKENAEEYQHLQEELSDVFWYVCRLCEHFDIDLARAVEEKAAKNAQKYPIEGCKS